MAYTYYIFHRPTNQHYYGARWAANCKPEDFWVTYFTSSKAVKMLIEEYGADSFNVEIRRIFKTGIEARTWEHKVIEKLQAVKRNEWLNKANGQPPVCNYSREGQGLGRKLSDKHKESISNGNKGKLRGRRQSPEHIKKGALSRIGKKHSSITIQKFVYASRTNAPLFTFINGDIAYTGTQADWAEKFNLNRNSAATTFCNGKTYKGWSRLLPFDKTSADLSKKSAQSEQISSV
jgi:hypothetical protein